LIASSCCWQPKQGAPVSNIQRTEISNYNYHTILIVFTTDCTSHGLGHHFRRNPADWHSLSICRQRVRHMGETALTLWCARYACASRSLSPCECKCVFEGRNPRHHKTASCAAWIQRFKAKAVDKPQARVRGSPFAVGGRI
jgi:hypothetical protein